MKCHAQHDPGYGEAHPDAQEHLVDPTAPLPEHIPQHPRLLRSADPLGDVVRIVT
jgi:hypothetical protein